MKDAEITEQRFSMCWFTLEIAAMAGTPPGNGRLIWVSHISSGVEELEPSSVVFRGAIPESCPGTGAAVTQTGAHMECRQTRQRLSLPCHGAAPESAVYRFFVQVNVLARSESGLSHEPATPSWSPTWWKKPMCLAIIAALPGIRKV